MTDWMKDIGFAGRILRKHPGFTTAAVLCLTLGIGAGSSLFLVVYSILLRPLPVAAPGRLVWIAPYTPPDAGFDSLSFLDLMDLQKLDDVFSGVAGYVGTTLSLRTGDSTEMVRGQAVTENYFRILGVKPALGRDFHAGEELVREPQIILSHTFWRRRFAGDPGIVGQQVYLNRQAFTVIGVAPENFKGIQYLAGNNNFWIPVVLLPMVRPGFDGLTDRGPRWIEGIARLKPGVTLEQARTATARLALQLARAYPENHANVRFALFTTTLGHPTQRGQRITASIALLTTAGLVLLFASANVTNLMLARTRTRLKEMGVRVAIGASRGRIARQILVETVLLFLIAGAASLVLAFWTGRLLAGFQPPGLGGIGVDFSLDWRVVLATLLLALLPGLLFGLAPALQASGLNVAETLRLDLATPSGRLRRLSLRNLLLAAQTAISLMLLIGAGLLVRTLQKTEAIDPGFSNTDVVMCRLSMRPLGLDPQRANLAFREILDRLQRLPAIRSAALAWSPPLGPDWDIHGFYIEGHQPPPGRDTFPIPITVVSPEYFKTLGIPLLQGRDFSRLDTPDSPPVVIINKAMADRFWPNGNAVGQRMRTSEEQPRTIEIAGVVTTGKYRSLTEDPTPFVYLALAQAPFTDSMTLLLDARGDTRQAVELARREVRSYNENLPLFDVTTMREFLRNSTIMARVGASLLGIFGLIAVALAAIGIYGLVSFGVAQRRHEIGIRMTLGAQPGQVVWLVLCHSIVLLGIGLVVGVIAALGFSQILRSFLFGVEPADPATYVEVILFFAALTIIASLIPARRAVRVDPVVSLRGE